MSTATGIFEASAEVTADNLTTERVVAAAGAEVLDTDDWTIQVLWFSIF